MEREEGEELTSGRDDDGDNQAINTKHTSHNDRYNGLHDQLRPHDTH